MVVSSEKKYPCPIIKTSISLNYFTAVAWSFLRAREHSKFTNYTWLRVHFKKCVPNMTLLSGVYFTFICLVIVIDLFET